MNKIILALLVLQPFWGLSQMRFISTDGNDYKLKHVPNSADKKIKIFLAENEIPDDFARIGVLIGHYKTQDKALLTAKNFAARAGADAIMMIQAKDLSEGGKWANLLLGGNFKGDYNFLVYKNTKRVTDPVENETDYDNAGLYEINEKVYYLVTPSNKKPATILEKISNNEYKILIHEGKDGTIKKTPVRKLAKAH